MNSLYPLIDNFHKKHRPLWILNKQKISTTDLYTYKDQNSRLIQQAAQHKKIALHFMNPVELLKTVILMQGIAQQILFIPWGTEQKSVKMFLERSCTSLYICDQPQQDQDLPDLVTLTKTNSCSQNTNNAPRENIDTRWVVPTSGTTGTPKLVAHTLASLTRTTQHNSTIGESITWGLLYDVTRFAGLQVFLQSLLGCSTLVLNNNETTIDTRLSTMAEAGVNALSATPTMWRKILMSSYAHKINLQQVTLGGEIADNTILRALKRQFTRARITHIYASTEAGVGFSVKDCLAGFPVSYINKAPNKIKIKIDSQGMMHLKPSGHQGVYLATEKKMADDQGYISTGDLVKEHNGRYYFLGRANGAINVGGNKVIPEEVEQVILMFPGVNIAHVAPKKSSFTGELVSAFIEIDSSIKDRKKYKKDLISFCKQHLDDFKVPAFIKFEDDMVVNFSGKLKRHNL